MRTTPGGFTPRNIQVRPVPRLVSGVDGRKFVDG
jgi:hypothetical protein